MDLNHGIAYCFTPNSDEDIDNSVFYGEGIKRKENMGSEKDVQKFVKDFHRFTLRRFFQKIAIRITKKRSVVIGTIYPQEKETARKVFGNKNASRMTAREFANTMRISRSVDMDGLYYRANIYKDYQTISLETDEREIHHIIEENPDTLIGLFHMVAEGDEPGVSFAFIMANSIEEIFDMAISLSDDCVDFGPYLIGLWA